MRFFRETGEFGVAQMPRRPMNSVKLRKNLYRSPILPRKIEPD
jgi:hypothetical protein